MGFFDEFKEMSTILLALAIVGVTFVYVVINPPDVIIHPLMESWGNIAFGFFFGSATTVAAYKMGLRALKDES